MADFLEKSKPDQKAVLQILSGSYKGKQLSLLSDQITLGRHSDCDIVFKENSHCSDFHARIKYQKGSYIVESLDPKNLVLINNKKIKTHIFKSKDKMSIGNVKFLFLDNVQTSHFAVKPDGAEYQSTKQKKSFLSPARLILIVLILGGVYLFKTKQEEPIKKKLNIRTEEDILKEIEELKVYNEKQEKKKLSPNEERARIAFIKGFRDYRKGYFHRALKMFQHCLTLYEQNALCQSYFIKSTTQIDKLIQTKIRLGNSYKVNRQYAACRAAFRSVEIMIRDSKNSIYKEAKENRKLCEAKLTNKI